VNGLTSSDSQFLNDIQFLLFRWSSYTKKKGFIIMFIPEKKNYEKSSVRKTTYQYIHKQHLLELLQGC
jgi:hypothetical protein